LRVVGQGPRLRVWWPNRVSNGLYNSYVLLAVPLFVFAANIMNAGTVSERIFDFCRILVGRMRGGLAQVDILVSVIFRA
jgi:TRAP-type C4-dicarboxylate transport system permease large subunit